MRPERLVSLMCFAVVAAPWLSGAHASPHAAKAPTPPHGKTPPPKPSAPVARAAAERALAAVAQRQARLYARVKGVQLLRTVTLVKRDEAGKVTSRRRATLQITERFGVERKVAYRACQIDGERKDPDDCAPPRRMGAYHPLFRDAARYRYAFVDVRPFDGVDAYRFKVTPTDDEQSYLQGHVYIGVKDQRLVGFIGSRADLPMFVKRLRLRFRYRPWQGGAVVAAGRMDLQARIPLVLSIRGRGDFTHRDLKPLR